MNYHLQLQMSEVFKTFMKTNYLKPKMASIWSSTLLLLLRCFLSNNLYLIHENVAKYSFQ